MFDLERAVADWRRQMQAGEGMSARALDELEDHLREEFGRKIRAGLDDPHAFEAAVKKLGTPDTLAAEFRKAEASKELKERRRKLVWMGVGALAYAAPIGLSSPHLLSQLDVTERWLATAAYLLTLASMFSGLAIYRILPVIPDRRTRSRVQMATLLLVILWVYVLAFVILPRVDFTIGRLFVATLWGLWPLAASGGIVLGLDEAAWRRTFTASS